MDPAEPVTAARLLGSFFGSPAFIRDRYLTVTAANDMARAVSAAFVERTNLARFAFLGPAADPPPGCLPPCRQLVALLRESVDHHPGDQRFRALVGELSALSRPFAAAFADPVEVRRTGSFAIRHAEVGPITLSYRELPVTSDHEETLVILRPTDEASRAALAQLRDALPPVSG